MPNTIPNFKCNSKDSTCNETPKCVVFLLHVEPKCEYDNIVHS